MSRYSMQRHLPTSCTSANSPVIADPTKPSYGCCPNYGFEMTGRGRKKMRRNRSCMPCRASKALPGRLRRSTRCWEIIIFMGGSRPTSSIPKMRPTTTGCGDSLIPGLTSKTHFTAISWMVSRTAVNPAQQGTKFGAVHKLTIAPGQTAAIALVLSARPA